MGTSCSGSSQLVPYVDDNLRTWINNNQWNAVTTIEMSKCVDNPKRQSSSTSTLSGTLSGTDAPTVDPLIEAELQAIVAQWSVANNGTSATVSSFSSNVKKNPSGISVGAIAGIVIGAIAVVLVLGVVLYMVAFKRVEGFEEI